jgi:hypothetical protein
VQRRADIADGGTKRIAPPECRLPAGRSSNTKDHQDQIVVSHRPD